MSANISERQKLDDYETSKLIAQILDMEEQSQYINTIRDQKTDKLNDIREMKRMQAKFDKIDRSLIKPKEEDLKFEC